MIKHPRLGLRVVACDKVDPTILCVGTVVGMFYDELLQEMIVYVKADSDELNNILDVHAQQNCGIDFAYWICIETSSDRICTKEEYDNENYGK